MIVFIYFFNSFINSECAQQPPHLREDNPFKYLVGFTDTPSDPVWQLQHTINTWLPYSVSITQ